LATCARGFAPIHDPEGDEKVSQLLTPDAVGEAFDTARQAPSGPDGEPDRRRFRAVSRAFLGRAALRFDGELTRRLAGSDESEADLELALIDTVDPETRRQLYARWESLDDRWQGLRQERAAAQEEAVAATGASGRAAFLAAEHPEDPGRVAASFEAAVIAPLDESVARAIPTQPTRAVRFAAA
jgi:hypothetical protein